MARLGSIGTQYFDDAGDPLIAGWLAFTETGTSTPKDTFSDIGLTIPNANPVVLDADGRQPDIFFTGLAWVKLYDQAGVLIDERDPIGGDVSTSAFPVWNGEDVYNIPDIVLYSNDKFYTSIQDANSGNPPATSPAWWTEIRFIRMWNTLETYATLTVVEAGDGLLYSALTGANLGNDPVTDTTNWRPAANAPSPAVIRAAGKTYAYNNF